MVIWIKRLIASLLISAASTSAFAWPDKPIRILVGFQAGGGSDIIAREIAEELRQELKARIVIDDRPGDAGARAIDAALAANDNHTLLLFTHEFLTIPLLDKNARFQTLRDFRPIAMLAEGPYVFLAGSKAPFSTFGEFVTYTRANPAKLRYATSGAGTQLHLIGHHVTTKFGLQMAHLPTRGEGGAANDLLDGKVNLAVLGPTAMMRGIRNNQLRPLAVTTSTRRPQLPDVPTLAELGLPNFFAYQRYGLVAAKNIPEEAVEKIAAVVQRTAKEEWFIDRLSTFGIGARALGPAEYATELREAETRWRRMIDEIGFKLE